MSHPSNQQEFNLKALFAHHPPTSEDQIRRYQKIRSAGKDLAEVIFQYCPPCADRSAAIRKIREAVMTANAAIALEDEGNS